MIQTLAETRARWTTEGRAGAFPVTEEDLRLAADRLRRFAPKKRVHSTLR
jgi:hypothetical protein